MYSDVAIIIPSRLGSERLYQKPLQLIGKFTMIEHIVRRLKTINIENVYVATDSQLIADLVTKNDGKYIMVSEYCNSGTDRVYQALQKLPHRDEIKYVINVQGDMPFVELKTILTVIEHLKSTKYDIITPVVKVAKELADDYGCVKVVTDYEHRALYFSRSLIPYGGVSFLYHIGIYGFLASTLQKFVQLPQSDLEKNEKLEQLRALQNNMTIGVCYVDDIPISIDTQDDLNKAIASITKVVT